MCVLAAYILNLNSCLDLDHPKFGNSKWKYNFEEKKEPTWMLSLTGNFHIIPDFVQWLDVAEWHQT